MPAWLQEGKDAVILSLHVQPGAKRTEIVGEHGDALKLRLASPPVDGKANAALIEFLAQRCGVPRLQVELVSGASARQKRVRIRGIAAARILALLLSGRSA